MKTVSWMHITDWHVGQSEQNCRWPSVRTEFERDFAEVSKWAGQLDLVFFSGDLVQSGRREEFEVLELRLQKLWSFFEKNGSVPKLIVIPGNHDLSRPHGADPVALALTSWHEKPQVQNAFWDSAHPQLRTGVASWFYEYSEWQKRTKIPNLPPSHRGPLIGDALYSYEKEGVKIGILGINSTFLQFRADLLQGQLAVSPHQVPIVPDSDFAAFLDQHHIRVLMTHQPRSWLSLHSQAEYDSDIWPPGRFDLHLCGHLHEADPSCISKGGSVARQVYQGTSFFGYDNVGDGKVERRHGYMLGQWLLQEGKIVERVWPRVAHKKHDGALGLVADPGSYLSQEQFVERTWHIRASDAQGKRVSTLQTSEEIALFPTSSIVESRMVGLSKFPQLKKIVEPQHWTIRNDERTSLQTALDNRSTVFLIADWGTGKDEFLTTCFADSDARSSRAATVFVLKCDSFSTIAELETGFRHQFGNSLQEYLNLTANISSVCLILDGVQPVLTQGPNRIEFERLCGIIRDFAPNSQLILVGRMPPSGGITEVVLTGLDTLETRAYVQSHPAMQPEILSPEAIERLNFASGGLPIQIDRLLERLQVASLDAVIDEESELKTSITLQDAALAQCIRMLDSGGESRTGMLLKALSVLPFGETIEGIKRFLHASPFYPTHAQTLLSLALLEAIPIHQTTTNIAATMRVEKSPGTSPKILRVPKQVRTCVHALMTKEELDEYVRLASEFIFGKTWKTDERIKLRKVPQEYRDYVSSGLGNEFAVITALLSRAAAEGRDEEARNAIKLGLHYCGVLKAANRYRDLRMVSKDLIRLIEGRGLENELADLHALCGRACRLTGEVAEAISHLEMSLNEVDSRRKNLSTGLRMLECAISLDGNGESEKALQFVNNAQKHTKAGTLLNSQIQVTRCNVSNPSNKTEELEAIEKNARSKGWISHANDTAIQLAALESNEDGKVNWLNKVLQSEEKGWNEYRAVIRKATVLMKNDNLASLTLPDRISLLNAYAFCHAQRLGEFDSCHACLWLLFEHEHNMPKLYALFRNSSFIWRLRGDEKTELEYYQRLVKLDQSPPPTKTALFRIEFEYFAKRAKILILRIIGHS